MNRIITILFLLLLLPAMALAQSGKLRGQITDQETGEALVGANIIIVGTSYGAATDVNGEYIILNLIAGAYEVKASYIGYQAKTISNVRINADLTTGLDFQLAAEGIQVGTVEVIAEKPLVNKYNTNANRITTAEDIDALPVRGVDNILSLTPGVVFQDNTIFIRGGRQDEVGFYLEGSNITDPMVGGRQVTLVQDALEEINVQSGGYNAEYGNANSGIIRQQIKSGTPEWKFSLEYITDNISFSGSDDRYSGEKNWADAYWFGYNETIFTLSGPLFTPQVKFFGLFNYNFINDANPQPLPGINLGEITDPATGTTIDLTYAAGARTYSWLQNYTGTGSFTFDFNPAIIRLIGTYTANSAPNPWSATRDLNQLGNILNTFRTEMVDQEDGAINLKYTHLFTASSFLEANVGYSFSNLSRYDPLLKDRWLEYGDGKANEELGLGIDWPYNPNDPNPITNQRYVTPPALNLFNFKFFPYGAAIAAYGKFNRQNYNFNLAYSSQITKEHNIKVGGEYQYYDIANFGLGNEAILKLPSKIAANPEIAVETLIRREGLNNYGYNPLGEKTNDGLPDYEQSRTPSFLGIYVQDRIEYNDLIINVGLRYDRIDIANYIPVDPLRPENTWDRTTLDVIPGGVTKTEAGDYVTPRIGFSFPVTDQTIFHAQWGKFVQQSRLRDVYQGLNLTGYNVGGGFQIFNPVGFDVKPTRTTQYEVGFTQQIGEFASVDITGFYKDIDDQILYQQQILAEGSPFGTYYILDNGDVATTKGVEIAYYMRRIERFKVDGNITFTDAKGTGSFPNSNRGMVGAPLDPLLTPGGYTPVYISPLEYNQAIRATINLDYRFGKGDGGPVLQELGLTLLGVYSSGHPYTRGEGSGSLEGDARFRQPLEPLNSSTTPSTFQVDMRIDKTFTIADVLNLNIYFNIINLFDAENVYNVFMRTGSADDDGYLGDPNQGGQQVATFGEDYARVYRALNLDYHQDWYSATTGAAYTTQPSIYGPPRQIRFGIRLEY
jgi:Carboxypeptidase regulatory-like domain/TonB-dependent Receptor Plug Domain